jgi:NAD(P)-dependent dehydrogenase (short-subunit alcohol dehydrogenase family)
METDLTGRTALITGGSLGLGLAMAKAFHQSGASVVIVARRRGPLDAACEEISAAGDGKSKVIGHECDVSSPEQIEDVHGRVVSALGGVDILVNNAGQSAAKPFPEITDEEWQTDIDLKLFAAIRFSRLVWPHMKSSRRGRIINVLNVFAKAPGGNTAPTSVTRAAGMALTKVLAAEGAPDNILVNAMLIGFIKSDQIRRNHEASDGSLSFDEFVEAAGRRLPMGRMGEAEEAANLALFLASDAASYLTGCAINMDGGLSKVV